MTLCLLFLRWFHCSEVFSIVPKLCPLFLRFVYCSYVVSIVLMFCLLFLTFSIVLTFCVCPYDLSIVFPFLILPLYLYLLTPDDYLGCWYIFKKYFWPGWYAKVFYGIIIKYDILLPGWLAIVLYLIIKEILLGWLICKRSSWYTDILRNVSHYSSIILTPWFSQ